MSSSEVFLSVVVPLYNEEKMVAETLRRIEAYFAHRQWAWELILVNDGSKDRTAMLVEELLRDKRSLPISLISYGENRGKGYAARKGMLTARGRYILLTDADLSSPIKECEKLIQALEAGSDLAVGSRAIRQAGCDVQQTLKRRLAGRIFNMLVQVLAVRGIGDTQCGFKCFKREVAHDLFSKQKLDGYSFDVEILYLARKQKLKIKEVPVMWRQGPGSKVSLFRDSIRMTADLFRILR